MVRAGAFLGLGIGSLSALLLLLGWIASFFTIFVTKTAYNIEAFENVSASFLFFIATCGFYIFFLPFWVLTRECYEYILEKESDQYALSDILSWFIWFAALFTFGFVVWNAWPDIQLYALDFYIGQIQQVLPQT